MKNPFKFGSVVEGSHFTNRKIEIEKVRTVLESENHLIIISPRRYGKTSLINKVTKNYKRPFIFLDLQIVTDQTDFASQLLKKVYNVYPSQKIKEFIKNFRIAPAITINPLTNTLDISYQTKTTKAQNSAIEDVLNLIENLGKTKSKPIVVFDEFQEIHQINKNLDRILRATMQHQKHVNYVFLGSQESLIREIFEKKKSPFYHFGYVLPLDKIPLKEFYKFLINKFSPLIADPEIIVKEILDITNAHPYYTQQLSFTVWEILKRDVIKTDYVKEAKEELVRIHDIDYERLWNTLNKTDKKVLIGMSISNLLPLSNEFSLEFDIGASSTIFSSLKRLSLNGLVIKSKIGYEIDDPFFKEWIKRKRLAI